MITLSSPATQPVPARMYQGKAIHDAVITYKEAKALRGEQYVWTLLAAADADRKLHAIPGPLQVKMGVSLPPGGAMTLQYQDTDLVTLHSAGLIGKQGSMEMLIDKAVAEVFIIFVIFINGGQRYLMGGLPASQNPAGQSVHSEGPAGTLNRVEAYKLKSMWRGKA